MPFFSRMWLSITVLNSGKGSSLAAAMHVLKLCIHVYMYLFEDRVHIYTVVSTAIFS